MKRDMDLIREILMYVEDKCDGSKLEKIEIEDRNRNEVQYHVYLCADSNLINFAQSQTIYSGTNFNYRVRSLTSKGHDFLDTIRKENIWIRIKNIALKERRTITIKLLMDIASQETNNIIDKIY